MKYTKTSAYVDFCTDSIGKGGCKNCLMTEIRQVFDSSLRCVPLFHLLRDVITEVEDYIIYKQTGVQFDYPQGLDVFPVRKRQTEDDQQMEENE